MVDISNVINVTLLEEGKAVAPDNMNVVTMITGKQGVLSTAERYRVYKTQNAVAGDFGSSSAEAIFASTFFDTSPNPISADGVLVIGYWRASDEDIAATSASIFGEQNTLAALVPILNEVEDGSFTLAADGGAEQVATGANFTTATTFEDILDVLNALVTDATISESNGSFIVTSDTTGATSELTFFGAAPTGTDISTTLGLSSESAAVLTQGTDSSVLTAETKLDGITVLKSEVNFKGAAFIDRILDADIPDLASWAGANAVIIYETFGDDSYLEKSDTNPVWNVALASQSNFRCLYSKSGNRKMAISYMARNHVVLFEGQRTAITLNLKDLSTPAEKYDETEYNKAMTVGFDINSDIKDVPMLFSSSANDFVDNVYNLMAFVDTIQSNSLTYLKITPTKIAQTDADVDGIEDDAAKTCATFVRAGVFAPGTWSLSDFFGDRDQLVDAIAEDGYYVLAGLTADQSTAARQARKSPVIQIAVKNAGAIHSEDIIITFNK